MSLCIRFSEIHQELTQPVEIRSSLHWAFRMDLKFVVNLAEVITSNEVFYVQVFIHITIVKI
ncbi:unnamed protein product [Nezara viridula]|uniref:Uncharacterized protein n=1 Tax=Nezara viridula TaxID=85310 RepID=A0A9P0HCI8_NEZVI|nr:unnamed protein product [Nezara viridula]